MKEKRRNEKMEEERREKKREKTRREKKQDKRKDKMKRERDKDERKRIFFVKNVSEPSNPPDELAQSVSKKNLRRTNYSSIFPSKVQNLAVFELFT